MKMRIGLAQMNARDDKEKNVASAVTMIGQLAAAGAELVLLPEHFDFIGPDEQKSGQAESVEDSSCLAKLRECAIENKIYVHIGSFLEREGEKVFNTGIVYSPSGQIIAKYRKIHLFDVQIPGGRTYLESQTITPGDRTTHFRIGDFVFGMATCYDLRFPELFRNLVAQGVHVFLLPAAFTLRTGKDHWELLLRARAVENQCWIAAAGQWGTAPPNHDSYGRSMVIDPWGLVVAQASDGITTLIAELDMDRLKEVRMSFPSLQHIRSDLF